MRVSHAKCVRVGMSGTGSGSGVGGRGMHNGCDFHIGLKHFSAPLFRPTNIAPLPV